MRQALVWPQYSSILTEKGSNQILGLPPTIATSSVNSSGLGPFSTTTGSGFGPSASLSPLPCPIENNTIYTNEFGTEYNALCGRDLIGDAGFPAYTDSFEKCLDFCDIFGGCAGVTYSSTNSSSQANCLPYSTFTSYAEGTPSLLSGVAVNGPAFNEFANRILCPAFDNQTVTDPFAKSYLIGCDKTLSGNADIAPTVLKTLAACLLYCSLDDGCSAVTFTGYPPPAIGAAVSYNCFPRSSTVSGLKKRQNGVISSEGGSQIAVRVPSPVPGSVTSSQTLGPVVSGSGSISATGTRSSFLGSSNSTQAGGSFSPSGTGTTGPGAGNITQTGGLDGASGTGTTATRGSSNSTVVAGALSTSSITGSTTPSGIASNTTSAATPGGSASLGSLPVGNSTSSLQTPLNTTSGRSPPNPSSTGGSLGNSTSTLQTPLNTTSGRSPPNPSSTGGSLGGSTSTLQTPLNTTSGQLPPNPSSTGGSLGNPTSGLQTPLNTTSGRLPLNPASTRGSLGNSTSGVSPTGPVTPTYYFS